MVTLCHISDTHMREDELDLINYPADILVHTGDFGAVGNLSELLRLNRWFKDQDYPHIINIAGNHDKICADMGYQATKNLFTNSTYLQDSMVECKGLKFWGSPWSQTSGNWSFMAHEGTLEKIWEKIPDDTDVLLVHGPPYDILDRVGHRLTGSLSLRDHILNRIKPKAVLFGHIHCSHGMTEINGIKFSNAAVLDDNYCLTQKPNVIVL